MLVISAKVDQKQAWFTKGWVALLGVVVLVGFIALVLPGEAQKARAASPEGVSIDTNFAMAPQRLMDMASMFNQDQKLAYIHARWTFDILWPLVYGTSFWLVWAWAMTRIRGFLVLGLVGTEAKIKKNDAKTPTIASPWRLWANRQSLDTWLGRMAVLPWVAVGFDLVENTAATVLLARPEGPSVVAAWTLTLANAIKWILVNTSMGGALILPIVVGFLALKTRKHKATT